MLYSEECPKHSSLPADAEGITLANHGLLRCDGRIGGELKENNLQPQTNLISKMGAGLSIAGAQSKLLMHWNVNRFFDPEVDSFVPPPYTSQRLRDFQRHTNECSA